MLEAVAATPYDKFDSVAALLSASHNKGDIDLLTACDRPGLDALPTRSFFYLQQVFCRTLPRLRSSTACAIAACERISERAGADGTSGLVFQALVEWLQQSPQRVDEGLEQIDRNAETSEAVVRSILLGAARQDPAKSTNKGLVLSNRISPTARLPALWAIARTLPDEDGHLLTNVCQRLSAVASVPPSEPDTAAAVDSALHLYIRFGKRVEDSVEAIVKNACRTPSRALRQALAYGLAAGSAKYPDTVIDECFSALRHIRGEEMDTLRVLDAVLYDWDIDGDRNRIVCFLVNLLMRDDGNFEFDSLDSFRHKLRESKGNILGWYVVSLLLTGRHAVCNIVLGLLPHSGGRSNLDIDLRPFSLSPRRILFLARKVLGYCLFKKECAAALLLSCLRAVSAHDQEELEDLVYEHFLINYPSAIEWLIAATSAGDAAKGSVDRLSTRVRTYLADLDRGGICLAFAPTERQRQIHLNHIRDLFRGAHKEAQQKSALLKIIPKANLLYGTGSIVYVHRGPASTPVREEMTMSEFRHEIEVPRLEELDPVGLQRDIHRFRSEPSPE